MPDSVETPQIFLMIEAVPGKPVQYYGEARWEIEDRMVDQLQSPTMMSIQTNRCSTPEEAFAVLLALAKDRGFFVHLDSMLSQIVGVVGFMRQLK